ncbi:TetR/AcrR family transcriptional regulator [Streptomyces ossamyceticus]|uniref:TetR/AcrR family transcriptional regulator n=1 Tax=Streptomyces ossamyceticus TaxID=249581 RepID=UPI0006E14D24|nr:TetR family transcriptional regulator C-terminal domain-containing protein [Streptomyces ossamyceticus]
MPRYVDHDQRRAEIVEAARYVLAHGGPAELTIRSVAKRLGGSITLVTHFYPTRPELMRAVVTAMNESFDAELADLETGADARGRLLILLKWMLPLTEQDWVNESGRVQLLSQRGKDASVEEFADGMDTRMRDLLRQHLEPLVPEDRVETYVDLLRVTVNGIVLAAVEHHDDWPAKRQLTVLDEALSAFGLR